MLFNPSWEALVLVRCCMPLHALRCCAALDAGHQPVSKKMQRIATDLVTYAEGGCMPTRVELELAGMGHDIALTSSDTTWDPPGIQLAGI